LILDTLAAREATVGQLVAELPRYEICKQKTPLERDEIAAALDALEKHFADAQADRLDGLRLDWPDRWLLVRASNTEPIVRLIAEAQSAADAESLCAAAAKVLADC